jgi:antitoxin MazE
MVKKLTKSGNSLALVIDKPLLDALGLDADTPLELSTDGDVLVVTPQRGPKRTAKLRAIVSEAHERFGGVFRLLAD